MSEQPTTEPTEPEQIPAPGPDHPDQGEPDHEDPDLGGDPIPEADTDVALPEVEADTSDPEAAAPA